MDRLESSSFSSSGGSTSIHSSEVTEDHSVLNNAPSLPLSLIPPSVKLLEEIATLEDEIIHLERHLLSLYRKAFQQHFSDDAGEIPPRLSSVHSLDKGKSEISDGDDTCQVNSTDSFADKTDASPDAASDPTREQQEKRGGHARRVSLAHHLGNPNTLLCPDKLSEEIIRCIASVYCKLSNPVESRNNHSASSDFSRCSSDMFSPRSSWSPQADETAALTREKVPYTSMLEVSRISLDKESYEFAAKMLHKFRSLVKGLEIIDPKKMSREEKLAFWINIHNALVMHGYLAYGTSTYMRSNSVTKASYNVGGICLNALDIQGCVLRIRVHSSAQWFQALLSPGKKLKTQNSNHPYAIDHPEPLVHFALSSGASTDPAVRVYSAKTIFEDLKAAKEVFIQSSVYIQDQNKLYLPKTLRLYAKDMSLSTAEVVDVVSSSLTAVQRKMIRRLQKSGRLEKYVYWIDQTSSFRYRIHQDLAQSI